MSISKDEDWRSGGRAFLKSDRWEEWRNGANDQKSGVLSCFAKARTARNDNRLSAGSKGGRARQPLPDRGHRPAPHRTTIRPGPLSSGSSRFFCGPCKVWNEIVREGSALRPTSSGGARHPFETYLFVDRVSSLEVGLYRYLSIEHQLALIAASTDLGARIDAGINNQKRGAAVAFVWSAIPYRTEWRYGFLSHKLIGLDAGHVCQNLYLAATAIGAGVCAIDAYDQKRSTL